MVCPAGFMAPEKWQNCVDTIRSWGFNVVTGKTMNSLSSNYFSGTDQERLLDLQHMLDDKSIDAILCGRGGYGTGRIIDQINFKKFQKRPKWVVGFSDITVLHAHLNRVCGIASIHGPMAGAFNEGGDDSPYIQSLKAMLTGKKASHTIPPYPLNQHGSAKARLVGGNLCLIAHLIGTPSAYKTKNKILFLEDVGEQLYNIDRMLYQLKRSGMLDGLAGLILGGFTENKDTDRPFGETIEEILGNIVKDADYPVCYNFPVSHEKENLALKVGGRYQLTVEEAGVQLKELE